MIHYRNALTLFDPFSNQKDLFSQHDRVRFSALNFIFRANLSQQVLTSYSLYDIDNLDQILSKIVFWKLSSSYSGIHVVKFYETYVWVFMKPGAIFSIFEVFQSILQPSGISDWK